MLQIIIDFGKLELLGLSIPVRVYAYGLMLVFGFISAIAIARYRAKRAGLDPDVLTQCGILSLIGGVLGARIAFVIEKWDSQFADSPNVLGEMLNITSGGLIYYGGVVLATVMVLVYLRMKRLPAWRYLDILAISVMVGLAFGRMGCTLNGCCYGKPCDEKWPLAMRFPMFSEPLIKLDGSDGPFSSGMDSPSPVYSEHLCKGLVRPDERLVHQFAAGKMMQAP